MSLICHIETLIADTLPNDTPIKSYFCWAKPTFYISTICQIVMRTVYTSRTYVIIKSVRNYECLGKNLCRIFKVAGWMGKSSLGHKVCRNGRQSPSMNDSHSHSPVKMKKCVAFQWSES